MTAVMNTCCIASYHGAYVQLNPMNPLNPLNPVVNNLPVHRATDAECWNFINSINSRRKIKKWFENFVGGDLMVYPHKVEVCGYLLYLSRVQIKNQAKTESCWLNFGKGIFAKLHLELEIMQLKHKPIFAKIKVLHGEGGVCISGNVQRV